MRERGLVLSWNAAEGQGVVQSTESSDELFVHFSALMPAGGFRALSPGQTVEFSTRAAAGSVGRAVGRLRSQGGVDDQTEDRRAPWRGAWQSIATNVASSRGRLGRWPQTSETTCFIRSTGGTRI